MSSYSLAYTVHVPLKASLASPSLLKISERIFRSCIDFCAIVGARILTTHSGYLSPLDRISESKALKLLANSLGRCARHAADSGVSIGVENGDMGKTHICRRTDKLVRVVEDTGMSNVGITLDSSHLYVSATYYGFDFMSAIRAALPHMIHTHLSDNFGKFDPVTITGHDLVFGYGSMHLPIGWGSMPCRDIIRMIKDDYKGIYMFEFSGYSEHFGHAIETFRGFFM